MEKVTDFVKYFSYITSNISSSLFILGLVLIYTATSTKELPIWNQTIPLTSIRLKYVGFILITVSVLWIIGIWLKIVCLRCKFPISRLEKDFFVVDVKGNVFLLDMRTKEIKWIQNWKTLSDLRLNGYLMVLFPAAEREHHWSDYTSDEIEAKARKKLGKKLRGKNYKFGEGIYTRGIPGT